MTSEITYAEVRFQNESKFSGIDSASSAASKERTAPHKSNTGFSKLLCASLMIFFLLLAISFFIAFFKTAWSCCPKNWKPFSSNCYFISTESASWQKSEKDCARMEAHLLVINTREEQDFIFQNLQEESAYFVGLSDPEGQRHWQWVDQTPYNESSTFWHPHEPSDPDERCVVLNFRKTPKRWGWNDIHCNVHQRSVCEMMKIHL
ncbi:PREDICTED: C-type lectin domain family 4 member A isoform X3 [Cercocebus atys]|uniref:C-type lectin domain family 4 member A n=1 Tax=Cercocebus atys TaxID=9531 RepID=A0A2K5KRV2_CERAT|nr:PREDICTED: C-type lectin domain family 4 member A isoform X3 [Cercocebus atys]